MAKTVAIGVQSFERLREENYFYIDKTSFIKEWWESGDDVTLITRPRRFGKTLNMSMLEQFFSLDYADRGELFEGLSIWQEEKFRELQGTYPVISLSFANIKEDSFQMTRKKICQLITNLYGKYEFILDSGILSESDIRYFKRISEEMDDSDASLSLYQLSDFLYRYYGKKVIILLDEYDTPMQEAYVNGFWDELVAFTRSLFNSTFKTNPYLARGVMTGITRVSKESIFSDLNNLNVVTTTSDEYATAFGFTEEEVFNALDDYGYGDKKEIVKKWYDGFTFGSKTDIYNPWSILNFLDKGKVGTYWANSSSNSLVGKLIREGNPDLKNTFEDLIKGKNIYCPIDEQIVYNQLDDNDDAIWSLLLASGYLKVLKFEEKRVGGQEVLYELTLTNDEVKDMFYSMVRGWFGKARTSYNDFVKAMLSGKRKEMNAYMNRVALQSFSYFDTADDPSFDAPERFYHGFVLGLIVDLSEEYIITSNRESGFGRYDVIIEPKDKEKDAIILEFKVYDKEDEKNLEDTVKAALDQIEEKDYAADLIGRGFKSKNIRKYGFAFEGKKVLIG
ncbi:MAG: ATP-binding protein [Lachnospiraceae bacterium]|nr:ATP-binding protein [Lachnospiraceae bacterium]